MKEDPVTQARAAAAAFFQKRGDADRAAMVYSGAGDDFPEVQLALLAQSEMQIVLTTYRRALSVYADPEFWTGDIYEATMSFHDQGETARFALAGLDLFNTHRD